MHVHLYYLDEFHIIMISAFGWGVVHSTGGELVAGFVDDVRRVVIGQHGQQQTTIPIIRDPTAIVTLACHVADGIKWHVLILIDKHLKVKKRGGHYKSVCSIEGLFFCEA